MDMGSERTGTAFRSTKPIGQPRSRILAAAITAPPETVRGRVESRRSGWAYHH